MNKIIEMLTNPAYLGPDSKALEYLEKNSDDLADSLEAFDVREIGFEIDKRSESLPKAFDDVNALSDTEIRQNTMLIDLIQASEKIIKKYGDKREKELRDALHNGVIIEEAPLTKLSNHIIEKKEHNKMENIEMRAVQKYLHTGMQNLDQEEQRALNIDGASAVIPTDVFSELITSEKYSDLLHRATVIRDTKVGTLQIPIVANTSASWKPENAVGTEATPDITSIELGGRELFRWMRMSTASFSLTGTLFTQVMQDLLASEVINTLEQTFIDGDGTDRPKGLDHLTWVDGTNAIVGTTALTAADLAEGISLLPAKYAKNAIVMCNASTLFKISQFKGTNEYAFSLSDGATKFLGKEISVNENVADDVVYIFDPKALYVRFAQDLLIEADRSSGFTSASIDLRALMVVDFGWNTAACVKVSL